jgi:hypothetical protein
MAGPAGRSKIFEGMIGVVADVVNLCSPVLTPGVADLAQAFVSPEHPAPDRLPVSRQFGSAGGAIVPSHSAPTRGGQRSWPTLLFVSA